MCSSDLDCSEAYFRCAEKSFGKTLNIVSKNKLKKFAELAAMENVFEFPLQRILAGDDFPLRGAWGKSFFGNSNPIVLELGCGRGEYTVGLARNHTDKNFIGIDIKGARMWAGATEARDGNLKNVAFVRTDIHNISTFFGNGEVSEIWQIGRAHV